MKNIYPLLLKPPIKDYLWGGTKLKTDFGFETEKDIAAEAWMLSCHTKGKSNQKAIWRYRALASDFYLFKHEYIFIFKKVK